MNEYENRLPKDEKTNWREDIRRALIKPSLTNNPEYFMEAVDSAIDIVACTYPGWNAFKEVHEKVDAIVKDYRTRFINWKLANEPMRRAKRYLKGKEFQLVMHTDIWTFLKNYCAKKGLFIDGPHDTQATKYGKDQLCH